MHPYSLLIKPAGADCNLQCEYCFYIDHQNLSSCPTRMTKKVLLRLIQSYLATEQPQYSFNWQGGEPTLMGVGFFRQVVAWQQKYGKSGSFVANSLQTNGTMLSAEWVQFLHEYNFLVGVSLDGPADIHDTYRVTRNQHATHQQVLKGIHHLEEYDVPFNILTLVNHKSVFKAAEIFEYFVSRKYYYHQYIPCVEFDRATSGEITPFSITGEEWGQFLCDLFDAWYPKYLHTISIRHFDNIINYLVQNTYSSCQFSPHCGHYFVVEADGSVYPCDFFVEDAWKLGNIKNRTWSTFVNHPKFLKFERNKTIEIIETSCTSCKYLGLCWGGCRKHRIDHDLKKKNVLCDGYRRFFDYSFPTFQEIANNLIEKH